MASGATCQSVSVTVASIFLGEGGLLSIIIFYLLVSISIYCIFESTVSLTMDETKRDEQMQGSHVRHT